MIFNQCRIYSPFAGHFVYGGSPIKTPPAPGRGRTPALLAAVLAAGGTTFTLLSLLGMAPLKPALVASSIVLAKLALCNRCNRRK
jgi:hypothetical protein